MKRINQFLHSEASVLLVLALALLAQTPHTATVFHRLATGTDGLNWLAWLHAVFYAVSLEFATLLFVARGNRRLAWTFAIVSVLANAAYYWHDNMTAAYMASAALISLALPACIAFYSHNVAVSKTVKLPSDDTDTTPPSPDLLPPTVKRRKTKETSGAVADGVLTLEEMLDGIDLDGVPSFTMSETWRGVYATTHSKSAADTRTAQAFGKSTRTVQRARLEGDWQ
jgi:hypothetical protein